MLSVSLQGLVCSLKDGFGFIRCVERETRMFFHFSEIMAPEREVQLNDEVQFTIIQDPTAPQRQIAVRICYLPMGTISLETVLPEKHIGTVEKLPVGNKSPSEWAFSVTYGRLHQLGSCIFPTRLLRK